MDRRGFLRAFSTGLAATAALATIDPEFLLWRPGAKSIFLPSQQLIAQTIQVRIPLRFIVQQGEALTLQQIVPVTLSFNFQHEADRYTAQWEVDNDHPGFFGPSKAELQRLDMQRKYPEYFAA